MLPFSRRYGRNWCIASAIRQKFYQKMNRPLACSPQTRKCADAVQRGVMAAFQKFPLVPLSQNARCLPCGKSESELWMAETRNEAMRSHMSRAFCSSCTPLLCPLCSVSSNGQHDNRLKPVEDAMLLTSNRQTQWGSLRKFST